MSDASQDFKDFVDSLPSVPARVEKTKQEVPAEERHNCHECAGTGRYKGVRIHQQASECFACKGRGWFKRSFKDRQALRLKAAARKTAKLEKAQAAYIETTGALIEQLRGIASWHTFARSLIESFDKYGSLTENQETAARNALVKVEASRAAFAAKRAEKTGEVDIAKIEDIFNTARGNGLKKLAFRTERLNISVARKHANTLYVKCDGAYAGKIVLGKFTPSFEAPTDILTLVRDVAASPLEAARLYGRKTGVCSCCGRELTDPKSIENGIGPICEDKWGL